MGERIIEVYQNSQLIDTRTVQISDEVDRRDRTEQRLDQAIVELSDKAGFAARSTAAKFELIRLVLLGLCRIIRNRHEADTE